MLIGMDGWEENSKHAPIVALLNVIDCIHGGRLGGGLL